MGIEEKLPSGVLLTTVEGVAGYMRKASFWPATFGLACCAIEMMTRGGPKYDLARFGMEVFRASPRQADLMIVAGRVSQKMAPVLRQIYDQMPEPKWVLAMGVCASSGGMFNNYAIVQGVDHVVPVDMYLPGCPPRPEMLIDAILKLHDQVQNRPLGVNMAGADRAARERRAQGAADLGHEGPPAVSEEPEGRHPRAQGPRAGSGRPVARERPGELPESEIQVVGQREGMFGVSGTGDTSGYGGLVQPIVFPGAAQPALRGLARGRRRSARHRAGRRRRRAGRRRGRRDPPRRDHLPRTPRGPAGRGPAVPRRPGPALRALRRCQRRALPRRHRARAARGLPPALDDPQPPGPARGHAAPTATRTSRRSSRRTRPTTGTSARPSTCSASSSTATRP